MTLTAYSWEHRLLNWALEALSTATPHHSQTIEEAEVEKAFAHCKDVTRVHSRTFFTASGLLPDKKRRAARALYAFCRVTDDIVDNETHGADREMALQSWTRDILSHHSPDGDPVVLAWSKTTSDFKIPCAYATQLIDGVARDLTQTRYQTFEELAEYAYGVASTVGLMAMHIIGFEDADAIPYAVRLGVALQLTNILRDVGEDARRGRIYLPQDELALFGITEEDIFEGRVTPKWREFMRFQIDRNRRFYSESLPGVRYLNSEGRFAIMAAGELYQSILESIEQNDYDVFRHRAHLSKRKQVSRLPGIWWRSRTS